MINKNVLTEIMSMNNNYNVDEYKNNFSEINKKVS